MTDVLATLKKLPKRCFVSQSEAKKKLGLETGFAIRRGEKGYVVMTGMTDEDAVNLNRVYGAKPHHIEAMIAGSMFGWHVPGADPDIYK